MSAYAESGHQAKIESERASGTQAGWGALIMTNQGVAS